MNMPINKEASNLLTLSPILVIAAVIFYGVRMGIRAATDSDVNHIINKLLDAINYFSANIKLHDADNLHRILTKHPYAEPQADTDWRQLKALELFSSTCLKMDLEDAALKQAATDLSLPDANNRMAVSTQGMFAQNKSAAASSSEDLSRQNRP